MKPFSLDDVLSQLGELRDALDELRGRIGRIEAWLAGVPPGGQPAYRAHPSQRPLGPGEQRRAFVMSAARARCFNRRLSVEARAQAIGEAIRLGALPEGYSVDDVYAKWRETPDDRAATRATKPRQSRVPPLGDLLAPAKIDFVARAGSMIPRRESLRFPIWIVVRLARLAGMPSKDRKPLDSLWQMACIAERRQALGDRARVLYRNGEPLVDDAGRILYRTRQIFCDPQSPTKTWYPAGTKATDGSDWDTPGFVPVRVRAGHTLRLPDTSLLRDNAKRWWESEQVIAHDMLLAKIRKHLGRASYLEVQAGLDELAKKDEGLHALAMLELAWALRKRRAR